MSETKNKKMLSIVAGLAIAIALVFFGCSENQSTSIIAPDELNDKAYADTGTTVILQPETTLVACDTSSFFAGVFGDSLSMMLKGKLVKFRVRTGALTNALTISVIGSMYDVRKYNALGEVKKYYFYTYEFGPDGLQFLLPMEIVQAINKAEGTKASLYYYDESTLDGDGVGWEHQECVSILGGTGTFHISHFSKYGISYEEDPGNVISGRDDPQQ